MCFSALEYSHIFSAFLVVTFIVQSYLYFIPLSVHIFLFLSDFLLYSALIFLVFPVLIFIVDSYLYFISLSLYIPFCFCWIFYLYFVFQFISCLFTNFAHTISPVMTYLGQNEAKYLPTVIWCGDGNDIEKFFQCLQSPVSANKQF